jgi:hypothetical protein
MHVRLLALAGSVGALSPECAAWADSPWYVSGSVGGYFREADSTSTSFFKVANPSVTAPGSVPRSFDPGVVGNVAVGYDLLPNVRVEAEFGYADYTGSALNPVTYNPNFPRLNGSA